jgi:hypothetical protein
LWISDARIGNVSLHLLLRSTLELSHHVIYLLHQYILRHLLVRQGKTREEALPLLSLHVAFAVDMRTAKVIGQRLGFLFMLWMQAEDEPVDVFNCRVWKRAAELVFELLEGT